MPTITEIERQRFKMFINNNRFLQHVRREQGDMARGLIISLLTNSTKTRKIFTQEVISLNKKYYLYCFDGSMSLITKDFKVLIKFNIRKPNPSLSQYLNNGLVIEIDNLNPFKKGHGRMLAKDILTTSTKLNLGACLWTENDKNIKYFERYNFESIGKVGKDSESLVIREEECI